MNQVQNAFTIDVEDWFHVLECEEAPTIDEWSSLESRIEDNFDRLLLIAESAGVHATCFFLGWVADHHPNTLYQAAARGHEIASHGYGHDILSDIGPGAFRADIERSIDSIEKVVGIRPSGYRAPGFSLTSQTPWAMEILAESGFDFDSSLFPAHRAHGGMPEAERLPHRISLPTGESLMEFPISVTSLLGRTVGYCGGGYLRLFPYWFIRSQIAAANARGNPVIVYVHPCDIDPGQPRIEMSAARRFKKSVNLATTAEKLRRLLAEFNFGTVSDSLQTRS